MSLLIFEELILKCETSQNNILEFLEYLKATHYNNIRYLNLFIALFKAIYMFYEKLIFHSQTTLEVRNVSF